MIAGFIGSNLLEALLKLDLGLLKGAETQFIDGPETSAIDGPETSVLSEVSSSKVAYCVHDVM